MPWRARLHLYLLAVIDGRAADPLVWWLRVVLACGVPLYALGCGLTRLLARPQRVACPVISVGNLTVGGAGKTPVVAWLAGRLQQRGRRVGILTRGYGRTDSVDGTLDAAAMSSTTAGTRYGDEPVMLARRLPGVAVIVGRHRAAQARAALQRRPFDVLLLDDGFQHWALARDLDIVVLDGARPFGNGCLLPLGTLREPVRALRRAQLILVRESDDTSNATALITARLRRAAVAASVVPVRYRAVAVDEPLAGRSHDAAVVRGASLQLLSAIAQPDRFESTVRGLGARVSAHWRYPDHYAYTAADWRRINDGRREPLLTTEKDWMRLEPLARADAGPAPVWVLRIDVAVVNPDDEALLNDRLDRLLRR